VQKKSEPALGILKEVDGNLPLRWGGFMRLLILGNYGAYPNTFAETSCISVMEALASGCFVVTSNWGYLPETTAGFARLISLSQCNTSKSIAFFSSISERESYHQAFLAAILEMLEVLTGANPQETEQILRKQVDYFNKYCT
jgi:glycosyltransferase involved in cell wall biosynthesis